MGCSSRWVISHLLFCSVQWHPVLPRIFLNIFIITVLKPLSCMSSILLSSRDITMEILHLEEGMLS